MNTVTHPPARGYRTIRLPIAEADYERFMADNEFAKATLQGLYGQHPELFPVSFAQGYALYGRVPKYVGCARKQRSQYC